MSCNFGLIGSDVSKSLSPEIHSYFGSYNYSLFSLEEGELISLLKQKNFDGLNITIPYKKTVMPYLDYISDEAQKIGSVNTIVNDNGKLCGYNTDYFGFFKILEKLDVNVNGKKALVLGSGGASLSIKAVLADQNAREIITVSRNGENNYNNIDMHFDANIIVNTTPVGKYPNNEQSPISLDGFDDLDAVIDINYNPIKSALLIAAEAKGIKILGGLTMLVWQAKKSAEYFLKKELPNNLAEKAINDLTKQMRNIVLIGMPSCGKTTIGKVISEKMQMKFFDTDDEIERQEGKHPSDIIKEHGESYFRACESKAVKQVSKNTGVVISVGGGAVLSNENVKALRQNGILIYLDRPFKYLSTENRPLSVNLEELEKVRKPIYLSASDIHIETLSTVEDATEKVLNLI